MDIRTDYSSLSLNSSWEEFLQAICFLNSDPEMQEGLRNITSCQEGDDHAGFSLIYEWERQRDLEEYTEAEKLRVLLGALKGFCEKSFIETHPKLSSPLMGERRG